MKKKNEKVPVLLVRGLLKEISRMNGMQRYLREFYRVHPRNFSRDYAPYVDLNRVGRMLTGISYKLDREAFLAVWMRMGERFHGMVSRYSDITDGSGI